MEGYEGLSDLLSNSIKYGLSNKRAIVIWGAVYLVSMIVFLVGYIVTIYLLIKDEMNPLAWAIFLLSFIPLIPLSVLLFGYVRRCLSGLFEGDNTAPGITELGRMAVDGLKIWAIYLEGIVLMVIAFLPLLLMMLISVYYPAAICVYCLLYPVEIVLMLLIMALNLVQWAVFADTGSLMSGLNPIKALGLIKGDLRYAAVAGIAVLIVYFIASVASTVLTLLVVTLLVLPFAIMPIYCACIYILARFYQHATGRMPLAPAA